jgi:cellulose synthase (UDP-forming)
MWTNDDLFRHRRAAPVSTPARVTLGVLIFFGLQSVALFAFWWFRAEHVSNRLLFVLLSTAVWYGVFRMLVGWYNFFHIEQPSPRSAPDGLSVAIFTTSSPGEPYEMFVRTLAAAREVTYPHTTYLLDDTGDPRFAALARASGAVHLELIGLPGAKAGKINAALERTNEDFILVLDPDHIPLPNFFDPILGHFDDARVGFV